MELLVERFELSPVADSSSSSLEGGCCAAATTASGGFILELLVPKYYDQLIFIQRVLRFVCY